MPGRLRVALLLANGFAAVTAIGGGLTLAVGLEGGRFPVAWLTGTPFTSYVLPGLILAAIVGGSALVATIAAVATPQRAHVVGWASVAAGLALVGWIVGEIAILTGDGEVVSVTELFYLALGAAMAGLGAIGARAGRARGYVRRTR
jgi:hypothetical protein